MPVIVKSPAKKEVLSVYAMDDFKLTCVAFADSALNIMWLKDGLPVDPNTFSSIVVEHLVDGNDTFGITKVNFTCKKYIYSFM